MLSVSKEQPQEHAETQAGESEADLEPEATTQEIPDQSKAQRNGRHKEDEGHCFILEDCQRFPAKRYPAEAQAVALPDIDHTDDQGDLQEEESI